MHCLDACSNSKVHAQGVRNACEWRAVQGTSVTHCNVRLRAGDSLPTTVPLPSFATRTSASALWINARETSSSSSAEKGEARPKVGPPARMAARRSERPNSRTEGPLATVVFVPSMRLRKKRSTSKRHAPPYGPIELFTPASPPVSGSSQAPEVESLPPVPLAGAKLAAVFEFAPPPRDVFAVRCPLGASAVASAESSMVAAGMDEGVTAGFSCLGASGPAVSALASAASTGPTSAGLRCACNSRVWMWSTSAASPAAAPAAAASVEPGGIKPSSGNTASRLKTESTMDRSEISAEWRSSSESDGCEQMRKHACTISQTDASESRAPASQAATPCRSCRMPSMTTSSLDVSVTSHRQLVAALTMSATARPAVTSSRDSTSAGENGDRRAVRAGRSYGSACRSQARKDCH
eukprot:scaffold109965_cov28-Tisochrysis_lutea.AAC.8